MIPVKRNKQEYRNYVEADRRVKAFLSLLGITDAVVTSAWRPNNESSQHSDASAIDIQSDQLVLLLRGKSKGSDEDILESIATSITGDPTTDVFRQFIIEHHKTGMLTRAEAMKQTPVKRWTVVNGKRKLKVCGSNMTVFHMAIYSDKFSQPVDISRRVAHSLRYDTYGASVANDSLEGITKLNLREKKNNLFRLS